jgi:CRISPR-associated endonuclease/helicase Cas3
MDCDGEEMTYFWAKTTSEGKPGISVYDHMINVGCVAQRLAEMSPDLLQRFHLQSSTVGALAALHDLGKVSPGFQRKCEVWLEENGLLKTALNGRWDAAMESDHGKVSHAAIQSFLVEAGADHDTAKFASAVLGAHHGRLNPPNDRGYRPGGAISEGQSSIDWDAERIKNAQMIGDYFISATIPSGLNDSSPTLWWLAGLTSVADWIGSDERFFSPEKSHEEDRASLARLSLDAIGFTLPVLKQGLSFEAIFRFPPNEMQVKVMAAIRGPGVYVVEAPMGTGKTEAALGAAYQLMVSGKANGIYFALPTQATSNRIHLRMNEFLQRIAPDAHASRLIHSNSWLTDSHVGICPVATEKKGGIPDDARISRDWFSSTKRSLLAPFGVGTVDQALLGVVAAKHFFVRHFALAGKVVILDEIHTYDLYTGTLIDKLITTLENLGCTVIVLSATLTGKRRRQIAEDSNSDMEDIHAPYPLITGRTEGANFDPITPASPDSRHVSVDFVTTNKASEDAIELARRGGAVLWVCNTVVAAQEQYQRFMKSINAHEFPVGLLHSRFAFWQREKLETEWMERLGKNGASRCGSILVSTQIVEQSVDLDADLLITELAPTDMLFQRLGRLWRHVRNNRPIGLVARMYIIEEEKDLKEFMILNAKAIMNALGSKAKVYAPYILLRSLEVWKEVCSKEQKQVSIPLQIRQLIESTYEGKEKEPEAWQQLSFDWFGTDSAKEMLAHRNSNLWQLALEDKEGVQTRVNEMPTVSLVLCRSIKKLEATFIDNSHGELGGDSFHFPTAQAIHKNIVKVPEYCFERVDPNSVFAEYVHEKHATAIVMENGSVEAEGVRNGIKLFYSDRLGLIIEEAR